MEDVELTDLIRRDMVERRPVQGKEFDELEGRLLRLTVLVFAMIEEIGPERAAVIGEKNKAICEHLEQEMKTKDVNPWKALDALIDGAA